MLSDIFQLESNLFSCLSQILFDEFCKWFATEKMSVGEEVREQFSLATAHENKKDAKSTEYDNHPDIHTRKFAGVEKRIQTILRSGKQLGAIWRHLDFNGNKIVSLAELDKFVVGSCSGDEEKVPS